MKHAVHAIEVPQRFFEIKQVELVNFQARIAGVLDEMLAPTGRKIIENPHRARLRVRQQHSHLLGADEARSPGDETGAGWFLRHDGIV